ncbi:TPA: ead/Ea22-like family protein [Raoultella ornithinolytica]|nr:ead/Ea22-like family protein [Raoultella ornithinolytica]
MTIDITELVQSLKAAITEATPGPWYVHDKPCEDGNYGIDTSDKEFLAEAVVWWGFARQSIWREEDAKYIALANPANILALVEALEKAQQHIARQEQILLNQDESLSIRRGELEKAQAQSSKWLEAYHKAVSIGARYEERIAELESRTTKLPPRVDSSNVPFAAHAWNCCIDEVEKRLTAAGIKVEAE